MKYKAIRNLGCRSTPLPNGSTDIAICHKWARISSISVQKRLGKRFSNFGASNTICKRISKMILQRLRRCKNVESWLNITSPGTITPMPKPSIKRWCKSARSYFWKTISESVLKPWKSKAIITNKNELLPWMPLWNLKAKFFKFYPGEPRNTDLRKIK